MSVEISPATTTSPVVIRVSQAQRPPGSPASTASSTLSGWPSVTDSDVKRNSRAAMARKRTYPLLEQQEEGDLELVRPRHGVLDGGVERLEVPPNLVRHALLRELLHQRDRAVDVDEEEALGLARQPGGFGRVAVGAVVGERLAGALHAPDTGRQVGDHEFAVDVAVVHAEVAALPELAHRGARDRGEVRDCLKLAQEDLVDHVPPVHALPGRRDKGDLGDPERDTFRPPIARPNVERVLA